MKYCELSEYELWLIFFYRSKFYFAFKNYELDFTKQSLLQFQVRIDPVAENSWTSLISRCMRECIPVKSLLNANFATRHSHQVAIGGSTTDATRRQSCINAKCRGALSASIGTSSLCHTPTRSMGSSLSLKKLAVAANRSTMMWTWKILK